MANVKKAAMTAEQEEKRAAAIGCTLKHRTCLPGEIRTENCLSCGWQVMEAERRKRLPLRPDGKGKYRKRVGMTRRTEEEHGGESEEADAAGAGGG